MWEICKLSIMAVRPRKGAYWFESNSLRDIGVPLRSIKEVKTPTSYCSPCEAFTSDNDAMIEAGREFPVGGFEKWRRKSDNKGNYSSQEFSRGRAEIDMIYNS